VPSLDFLGGEPADVPAPVVEAQDENPDTSSGESPAGDLDSASDVPEEETASGDD